MRNAQTVVAVFALISSVNGLLRNRRLRPEDGGSGPSRTDPVGNHQISLPKKLKRVHRMFPNRPAKLNYHLLLC
jgi:hypothetical protein